MTTQKETRTSAIRGTGAGPSTTYMAPRSTSDSIGAVPEPRLSATEIADAKSPAERISRRCYLSLHAAEKAVKRAQARGSAATLELRAVVRIDGVSADV